MMHKGTIIPQKSRDNHLLSYAHAENYTACMVKNFREALIDALEKSGTPLKRVAEQTGVSYEQLKKLRQGKSTSTNVDDAVLVANYFGQTLEEFLADSTAALRSEIVDLYNQLTPEERRFLLASAKGMLGERDPDTEQSQEEHHAV